MGQEEKVKEFEPTTTPNVSYDHSMLNPTFGGQPIQFDDNEFDLIPIGKGVNRGSDGHARLSPKKEKEEDEPTSEVGGSILMGCLLSAVGAPHFVHTLAEGAKVIGENLANDSKDKAMVVDSNIDPAKRLNPAECFKPASTARRKSVFDIPSVPSVQDEHAAASKDDKKRKLKKLYGR